MTSAVLLHCTCAARRFPLALAALLAFPAHAQAPSGAAGTITAAVPVGHVVRAQQTLDAARATIPALARRGSSWPTAGCARK